MTAPDPRIVPLLQAVKRAARLLPMQGPIGVFVHHNTLHALEHLPFEQAVLEGLRLLGAEPYLAEAQYRAELARGRIRSDDIDAILESEPDALVFPRLSRRSLRRAMMTPGVREFDAATILWRAEQGDLADDFHHTALRALFDACLNRTVVDEDDPPPPRYVDDVIHPVLIRLCAVFLDQGLAYWTMPHRDLGFYRCVRSLLSHHGAISPRFLDGLDQEFRRQQGLSLTAADAVLDCLDAHGIAEPEWEDALRTELLALPGWAGLMRRLEENPALAPHETVPASLVDFLAVRLTLGRVAAKMGATASAPEESPLKTLEMRRLSRAARLYDAARVVSLSARELAELSDAEWTAFVSEVKACNGLERRRILHLAYERRHETEILHGLASHRKYRGLAHLSGRPSAQVFCCIDERYESLRRALEEVDPSIETLATAGYFGIAVDYQGIDDPDAAALCPIVVKPKLAVVERPLEEDSDVLKSRQWRRHLIGLLMRYSFVSSKTLLRGWLSTTALGMLSAIPLVGHLLAPRRYALLREWLNQWFLPVPRTELAFMRNTAESQGVVTGLLSATSPEVKADAVASVLAPAGLIRDFSRLVLILGHGSTSLNNPHESAHDCGACGGRRGGPNARLFADMANLPEVRAVLRTRGIDVADDVRFVGAYHDSCSDDVEFFDLDALPSTHQPDLDRLRQTLDRACTLNAHERVRRFESCPLGVTPEEALRHVEERSEHLAQPRPQYGHCTNAVSVVGRRALTRGLFLDRRAFLVSYDAALDPEDRGLAALMTAIVPVCAGISLEYYFSVVDNSRYGCGTKLPHNVTGLIGVMDGHASDLRTGLPVQMVSIHEPVRMLFVIETQPHRFLKVLQANASFRRLAENRWVRIACIDPDTGRVSVLRNGAFEDFPEPMERLPVAYTSSEWYAGKREHLPMAWIQTPLEEVSR